MDRLAIEELISAWLDDRQDLDLRRRIDTACACDPACGRLLADYEKLDALIRQAADRPLVVDWADFKIAVSTKVARSVSGAADSADVDRFLREALPSIEPRINWDRYARRVSRAVDECTTGGRVLRISHWRTVAAVAGLAAAAAVILWIGLPFGEAPVARPSAAPAVAVSKPPASISEQPSPAAAPTASGVQAPAVANGAAEPDKTVAPAAAPAIASAVHRGPAMVRVRVIEESALPPAVAHAGGRQTGQRTSEPEVFFMLEPPDRSVLASAGGFGSY